MIKMHDLVEKLKDGETITYDLQCGNKLTITPQIVVNAVEGFFVESRDVSFFATTEETDNLYHVTSKYVRFYISSDAIPFLFLLLRSVNRIVRDKNKIQCSH